MTNYIIYVIPLLYVCVCVCVCVEFNCGDECYSYGGVRGMDGGFLFIEICMQYCQHTCQVARVCVCMCMCACVRVCIYV